MSFSYDPSKNQPGGTAATNATAAGAAPNFSFGASGAGDAGKALGTGFSLMSTPSQNKPGGLYTTGPSTTPAQSTGFSFGATTGTATPVQGTAITSAQATGLSFGTPITTNTSFTFGSSPATSINFGAVTSNTPAATSLTFGTSKAAAGAMPPSTAIQATTSSGPTALTFGSSNVPTSSSGFGLGVATLVPSATTATTTTTTAATSAAGFSLGSVPPATTSGPGLSLGGFSLGAATSTSATSGFSHGGPTTVTTATGFNVGKTVSTAAPTSLATATTQASLGTTTTVTSSNATQLGAINFCQLEESINKWTLELEEQEKAFINQAAQVNAWDKLLITNGEKIVTLNQEVERVKLEQQQLEHELDYVVGQQKELQDCLVPLEKELASLSVSDPEREYTYRLAENLDTQLKQMSEDLKEIIEHLNEANRIQDSSDPIVQIGKILNAHMNSLQWLDQRTTLLAQKIQQIDQMHQNFRQENERNFSLAYN